jgi:hypothetical protein
MISKSIKIFITIIKDNTPELNCVYITFTWGDHLTRNADIHFKMW